jgi:hypothetical protein
MSRNIIYDSNTLELWNDVHKKLSWFSPGPPVSSTNKTDIHEKTEKLLKVALNTIKQTNKQTNKQTSHDIDLQRHMSTSFVKGSVCIGS